MSGAAWVILGEANHTARIISFLDNLPEGNVAIVAGEGEDAGRIQLEVGDLNAAGIKRREIFVDASDCSTEDSLQAKGKTSFLSLPSHPHPICGRKRRRERKRRRKGREWSDLL